MSDDELTALRKRAYGADADITAAPEALARLRELEERTRAQAAAPASSDPAEPAAAPEARTPTPTKAPPAASPVVQAPAPSRVGASWIAAWAASVAVVALVVGLAVHRLVVAEAVSTHSDAERVATLTDAGSVPQWLLDAFGPVGGRAAYRFEGLIVVHSDDGVFRDGSNCLLVVGERDATGAVQDTIGDPVISECTNGAFPATVQFAVEASSPEELRARFPLGTGLRFVLEGERVGVFAAAPVASPTPDREAASPD